MLLIWTLSLYLAKCQTAPIELDTDTTIQYISFQQQPNIQGTYDILSSCIATMTLCIWAALHLNLPVNERVLKKMLKWKRVFYHDRVRKLRWIAMGLFAPEIVVYNAWMQRKHVVKVTRWATVAQDLAVELGIPQPYKCTVYHSWYMLMGGFILRTSENGEPDFIAGSPDFILGSKSMAPLRQTIPPLLPEISTEEIKEHNKADSVTKVLALLQALYQTASGISRLLKGLPLSQLEINTFGHVVCAALIFFLWFQKPKDVKARTIIRAPWARRLCAFLWMSSDYSTSYRNLLVTNSYPCGQAEDLLPSIYDDDIEYSNFFCFAGEPDGTGAFWPMGHSEGCKAGLKEQQCGERTDREYEKKDEKNVPDDLDHLKPPAEQHYRKHCDDVHVLGRVSYTLEAELSDLTLTGILVVVFVERCPGLRFHASTRSRVLICGFVP